MSNEEYEIQVALGLLPSPAEIDVITLYAIGKINRTEGDAWPYYQVSYTDITLIKWSRLVLSVMATYNSVPEENRPKIDSEYILTLLKEGSLFV